MFEVVGLSKNEILKEKLSEFFVGTSMASSSQNKNNSAILLRIIIMIKIGQKVEYQV